MAEITYLKKTPIHCVVKVSGSAEAKTITLATDLLFGPHEVASTPVVNIMGLHWSIPGVTPSTIVRNGKTLWALAGAWGEVFNGWVDNQENTSDIVVTLGSTGTIVLELLKSSGYNNTQHRNVQDTALGDY